MERLAPLESWGRRHALRAPAFCVALAAMGTSLSDALQEAEVYPRVTRTRRYLAKSFNFEVIVKAVL
jgi:hypothetical protein